VFDSLIFSVVSTYYYGNLTHPSQDPPKMGFFSTVPRDAGELLKKAVGVAAAADGNFPGKHTFHDSYIRADKLF
jgi:hypothetical protein